LIWGCFVGDKLGPIVFIDRTVNQDVYIDILRESLIPFIEALKADGATNLIFQQDNATPHKAQRTMKWLGDSATTHGFSIMEWPPNSPDLNPIEHLWAHLKLELHRRYPDTASLKGSSQTIKTTLRQRLHEVWWDIGQSVLENLIASMPLRVNAVLSAEGWYTDF
jgi:transposase